MEVPEARISMSTNKDDNSNCSSQQRELLTVTDLMKSAYQRSAYSINRIPLVLLSCGVANVSGCMVAFITLLIYFSFVNKRSHQNLSRKSSSDFHPLKKQLTSFGSETVVTSKQTNPGSRSIARF